MITSLKEPYRFYYFVFTSKKGDRHMSEFIPLQHTKKNNAWYIPCSNTSEWDKRVTSSVNITIRFKHTEHIQMSPSSTECTFGTLIRLDFQKCCSSPRQRWMRDGWQCGALEFNWLKEGINLKYVIWTNLTTCCVLRSILSIQYRMYRRWLTKFQIILFHPTRLD